MPKACRVCGTTSPPHGWKRAENICRTCDAANARAYYRAHAEECRKKAVEYRRTHPGYEKRRLPYEERKRKRGMKLLANSVLTQAVRHGRVKKPNRCESCGTVLPKKHIHGHHPDYNKPLEVRWLCVTCHGAEHRRFG